MNRLRGLLLLFVPLAVACSASTRTQPPLSSTAAPRAAATSTPFAGKTTTITWSFWGDPHETSINERIVKLFEQDHPEIDVQTRWASFGDYIGKLQDWWASDDAPDVAFLYDIPAFAPQGVLAELYPFISRDHYDLTDFYPELLSQFTSNGNLYGLPRDNDTKVIFYNKDLFDAAHVPYPRSDWTWNDLRTTAKALTIAGDSAQYGFAFETASWWKLWVWQNGGQVYDVQTNPTRTTIDSPQAIAALRFTRDLMYTDRVTPPYDQMTSSQDIGDLFTSNRLAMAFGNHALVPLFASKPSLHWGVVGLPRGTEQANYAGGAGYVISAASQHKEAAWTFLQWLLSAKGEAIFTESGLIVPSRRSVGNSNLFLRQSVPAAAQGEAVTEVGRVFLAATERGRGQPAFPGSTAIFTALDQGLAPIWRDGADPEEVVRALVPSINSMLGARR
jgi:multiple sugar transport system substrate-binding protein